MIYYLTNNTRTNERYIDILTPELYSSLSHHDDYVVKAIRNCRSSELAGVIIRDNNKSDIDVWPEAYQPLSSRLINQLGSIVIQEQKNVVIQNAQAELDSNRGQSALENYRCPAITIDITEDRSLIAMIIPKENEYIDEDRAIEQYVSNPNYVVALDVPSLPVGSVDLGLLSLAYNERMDRDGTQERTLPWLTTVEHIYQHLVDPYLMFVKKLHDDQKTHGDITESNAILSDKFGKLIFIDFKHIGEVPCVEDAEHVDEYAAWHIARLTDLREMCESVLYHTKENNQPMLEQDPVMNYFRSVAKRLANIYSCNPDDDEWDDVSACALSNRLLTIDTLIDRVNELRTSIHMSNSSGLKRAGVFALRKEGKRLKEDPSDDEDNDQNNNADETRNTPR